MVFLMLRWKLYLKCIQQNILEYLQKVGNFWWEVIWHDAIHRCIVQSLLYKY